MKRLTCLCQWLLLVVGVLCVSPTIASSIPHIYTWKTSAGTPVYFVRRTQLPMLDMAVVFDAGSARDNQSWGLSLLTNQGLDEGTTTLTADQIAETFAAQGAIYDAEASKDMAVVSVRTLTNQDALDVVLPLFNNILTQPSFPKKAMDREHKQMLTMLKYEEQDPVEVAQKTFYKALYGKAPYAHASLGTTDTVTTLTDDDVRRFYHTYYVAHNVKIVMIGNLTVAKAKKASEQLLQGMPAGEEAKPLPTPSSLSKPIVNNVDFDTQQSTIFLGQLGMTRENPDYFALIVGNHALGGMPLTSVLFESIRNQYGLAYSIGSYFLPLQQTGPFLIVLQTQASNTLKATTLTKETLGNFVKQGVTQQQLQAAKSNLLGSFPIAISSNEDLMEIVIRIAFYNRPRDYLETYHNYISAVTASEIKKAFSHLIAMNDLVVVTVGPDQAHAK